MFSDAQEEYRTLTAKLNQIIAEGRGDDPEADAIRDQMDKPWRHMIDAAMSRTEFRPPFTDPGATIEVKSQETPAFALWPQEMVSRFFGDDDDA